MCKNGNELAHRRFPILAGQPVEATMRVADVMTRDVAVVRPDDAIRHAAQKMDELNVGVLPVCKGRRLVGMITDRDITVRATAAGRLPHEAKVEDAMSGDVRWCFEDASTEEVLDMIRSRSGACR
jgi:CBS domain-containing protein